MSTNNLPIVLVSDWMFFHKCMRVHSEVQILQMKLKMGFSSNISSFFLGIKNLFGIDVSEKAIDMLKADHDNYHAKVIEGFDYNVFQNQSFDLAYHFAVFGEIPLEEYDQFFQGISKIKPKFYMFVEGISLDGYKVVPKSFKKALELKNKDISTRNNR